MQIDNSHDDWQPIQWFPGHMHKARKQIRAVLKEVDLIIEMLDARLPIASANPLIEQLSDGKPCVKLFNKADLADPEINQRWLEHCRQQQQPALLGNTKDSGLASRLLQRCKQLGAHRKGPNKSLRLMILGVPNVGKSSLMNLLAGKKVAKTGNQPALTRAQQWIRIAEDVRLLDTPGILWPKIEPIESAYHLAASGAIRNTAMDHLDVALFSLDRLRQRYPEALRKRYKLAQLDADASALLGQIGAKRGCLIKGGGVDLHKAGELLLQDLRSGLLGRYSLETPDDLVEAEPSTPADKSGTQD